MSERTVDWRKTPPFITSNSGNGRYWVEVKVHSLQELHAAHGLILDAFADACSASVIFDALESRSLAPQKQDGTQHE